MKTIFKKYSNLLGALALLFSFNPLGFAETAAFTLSPSVVSNTYNGTITLQVTGLSPGESVVVQKFLDANSNGVVDAGDFLVQQFNLTNGQASVFGSVTNMNVPGDTGTIPGQITAVFNFNTGAIGQTIVGQFAYVVSSPSNNFTAVTNLFNVTNTFYAQSFNGDVVNSGTNVPYAVVLLFQPSGNNFNLEAATLANSTGHYAINVPAGTYLLAAIKNNYVTDLGTAPSLALAASVTISTNLTITNATQTISGSIVNSNNPSIGVPGLFGSMETTDNLLATFSTDTNGNFTCGVTADTWKVSGDEASLALLGYLKTQNKTSVPVTTANVSGVIIKVPLATALFYGRVKDGSGNPMVGVSINGFDMNGSYNLNTITDQNGNYFAGVVGGLSSDPWQVEVGSASDNPAFANYIFSQTTLQQSGGTNLGVGRAVQQNYTGLLATNQISGTVTSNGVIGISGVGVSAYDTISGQYFQAYVDTDGSGNYSFMVPNGNWGVNVNCNGGNDSLSSLGNYLCPGGVNTNIAGANAVVNFNVQTFNTSLSGKVVDDGGNPVTFMNVFAFTNGGNGYFQATTDSGGNFSMGITGGSYTLGLNNDPNTGFPSLNLVGPSVPVTVTTGVNINNFILVAPRVTGHINVQVNNPASAGVPNIGVFATITIGDTNYTTWGGEIFTGTSGAASLPVFNGTWQVNLDGNNVQSLGYTPPSPQNATISGNTLNVTFTLASGPLNVGTGSLPIGTNGSFYSTSMQASGGHPPYTWSIPNYSASPPANLSLSTNGVVSGIPASAGNFSFFVRVTDATSTFADSPSPLSLTITNPAPVLSAPFWQTNRFQMRLTGLAGLNYSVQVSTNLQPSSWTLLYVTNNATTNSFLVVDPNATNKQRSYRILVGP
jgi:hypothetical protein